MPKYSKQKYKQYIADGNVEELMDVLLEHLHQYQTTKPSDEAKDWHNEAIMLSGRWKTILHELRRKLITSETAIVRQQQVQNGLLALIDDLPLTYFSFFSKEQKITSDVPDLRVQVEQIHHESSFEYDVFLSFSSKDEAEAKQVYEELRGYGMRVFHSGEILKNKTGISFFKEINHALQHSQHFILLSSPNSMTSEWVIDEYETFYTEYYIQQKKKRRLIVLKAKAFDIRLLPPMFRRLQIAENVQEILEAITERKRISNSRIRKSEGIVIEDKNVPASKRVIVKTIIPPLLHPILVALEENMIDIPSGTFTMGYTFGQKDRYLYYDEKPTHKVTLDGFKMNKYPVTQEEWRIVMGKDPKELSFKGCNKCPVENVSWKDVQKFLKKLNQLIGKNYRLPTEAEWEYAARGEGNYIFAGSNDLNQVAWYIANSNNRTHPVGQKKKNGFGLYDMGGNVWEWCSDWYGKYTTAALSNPVGANIGRNRVIRGGSWGNEQRIFHISYRGREAPTLSVSTIGFRLVLSYSK